MLNKILSDNLDWVSSQWTIDIHSVMPDFDEDNSHEEEENVGPHIYCIKKYLRPRTRSQMAVVRSTATKKRKRRPILQQYRNIIIRQHYH